MFAQRGGLPHLHGLRLGKPQPAGLAELNCWLEQMRHEGDFFPVDQLLVHSDHLLAVVDALDVSGLAADKLNDVDMRRAQALLKYEAASAYSSRGQHERSVGMLERALEDINGVELSPPGTSYGRQSCRQRVD